MEDRKYTWLKKNPVKQARLDFFLISNTTYSKVDKTDILPGYRTDHSLTFPSVVLDKTLKRVTPSESLIILYLGIRAI